MIRTTLILLFSSLLMIGCLEERTDEPADDAGAADGAAVIDATYDMGGSPDAGPAPGPDLLALGAACVASSECKTGNCALPCAGYGACAPATCKADGDCKTPGSRTYCCVDGTCSPITGGTCGDRKGQQGDSCAAAGQSACADGLSCLASCVADAYCSASCKDSADCTAKDPKLACFNTFAAGKRCVTDPDQVGKCTLDGDCAAGALCGITQSFDGTKVIKVCKKALGPGGVGASCTQANHCAVGQCLSGSCTKSCTKDEQCLCAGDPKCIRDQICMDVFFSLKGGYTSPTKLCFPLKRCDSTADCGSKTCMIRPQTDGWATVCEKPLSPTAKIAGAGCSENKGCKSNVCHDGSCRDLCKDDKHCDKGSCKQVEVEGEVPKGSKVGVCLS